MKENNTSFTAHFETWDFWKATKRETS